MELGIFAKTFAGDDPLTVFQAARAAGYSTVQYNMACSGIGSLPARISPKQASAVAEASAQTGIGIAAVSATYNMTHPDLHKRQAGRAAFAEIAAKAGAMGTKLVSLCTGSMNADNQWAWHVDNDTPAAWAEMIGEFNAILPIAEQHDVVLAVEPEMANIVSSAKRAKQLIDELGGARIGFIVDPANLFAAPQVHKRADIIAQAIDLLSGHIVMAHAKDRAIDGDFVAAGQGCVDFDAFVSALNTNGFDGPLVTHGCTATEAPAVAEFLAARLAHAETAT